MIGFSAPEAAPAPATRRAPWLAPVSWTPRALALAAALPCIPAFVDPDVMRRLDALRETAPVSMSFAQAVQLHAWAPLVAMSAAVLFLLPGLVLAFPRGGTIDVADWLVRGAALSIAALAVAVPLAQGLTGGPLSGRTFSAVVLGLALVLGATRTWLPGRRESGRVTGDRAFLVALVMVPAAMFSLLPAKFLWESLNGDGAHAFEAARLLLRQPVPFWPAGSGPIASFPGATSFLFALPSSWFLRLFGELDVAARLPVLMHMALLTAAVAALVPSARLRHTPRVLIWLGLLPYFAAMAWSATYSPYSADLALPATQDTLLMVFVLGAMAAWDRRDLRWLAVMAALSIASLPNGFILMGLLAPAAVLAERPRPWRAAGALLAIVAACLLLAAAAPALLRLAGQPAPGNEYGAAGLLRYFAFLQATDWRRVLYVAIPCGLVPVVTALRWRRLDGVARTLVLIAAAYFLFFYVQAYTALHHYVPSMLLLLAAHWRAASQVEADLAPRWHAWTAAGALVALVLALPRDGAPHRDGEQVGRSIVARVGDYARSAPAVFRASTLLNTLFPYDWAAEVPGVYGGSPLVWNRYARHNAPIEPTTNYVLEKAGAPAPAGMRELARDDNAVLYVRSDSAWQLDRRRAPSSETGSPWLTVPRGVLFRSVPRGDASPVIDVVALLERAGIDVDALLGRMRVSP